MAAFVQVGVKEWMFSNVQDICQPNQRSSLTCPHNQVFFTASAVWCVVVSCFASYPRVSLTDEDEFVFFLHFTHELQGSDRT